MGFENCGVLHSGSNYLRNGARYALGLYQYRTLIENHIVESNGTICGGLGQPEVPKIRLACRAISTDRCLFNGLVSRITVRTVASIHFLPQIFFRYVATMDKQK